MRSPSLLYSYKIFVAAAPWPRRIDFSCLPFQNSSLRAAPSVPKAVRFPIDHRISIKVRRNDFTEAAAAAYDIRDFHSKIRFNIAFSRAGDSFGGQKRVPDDEAALDFLVIAAVLPVIIIREGIQAILLRQPPLRAGDLRRPAELRFLRTPRDRIENRIVL